MTDRNSIVASPYYGIEGTQDSSSRWGFGGETYRRLVYAISYMTMLFKELKMKYKLKTLPILYISQILFLTLILQYPSLAKDFNQRNDAIINLVKSANDVRLRDFFNSEYIQACLVSKFPGNGNLASEGITCHISGNALAIFRKNSSQCEVIHLESLGKILTGSEGEWDCVRLTEATYLEVLDRDEERFIFLEQR